MSLTGRHKLLDRLASQVGSKDMAMSILKKRGQMTSDGRLTAAGRKRDSMTASERAISRAVKANGGKPGDYKYSVKTNRATKK